MPSAMCKLRVFIFCILLSLVCFGGNAMGDLSPKEILERADEYRGRINGVGISSEVTLHSEDDGHKTDMVFLVLWKGFDVLATTLSPDKSKGNKTLVVNGNTWFYKPGLSRPVAVSQRQKLMGQAVYADIASTNYANDYDADLIRQEEIDNEMCYVFYLKAKTPKATYDRIRYWVSVKRLVGVKADYITISGMVFKSATMKYDNYLSLDGKTIPLISGILIWDTLTPQNRTTLAFEKMKTVEIPDTAFDVNSLKK